MITKYNNDANFLVHKNDNITYIEHLDQSTNLLANELRDKVINLNEI